MALRLESGEFLSRSGSPLGPTAITAMGWCQIVSDLVGVQEVQPIFAATPDAILFVNWSDANFGETMVAGSWDGSTPSAASFPSRPAVGEWFCWYLRCDGTTSGHLQAGWRRPSDAAWVTVSTDLISTPALTDVYLGGFDTLFADSRVASAKIWSAFLTDAEIENEWRVLRPHRFANLWQWSPMVADAAVTADNDFSGNARDWTPTGTPSVIDGPPISWGGQPAIVSSPASAAYALTAASAAFAETGVAAGLLFGRLTVGAAGSFAETGVAANLLSGRKVAADVGAFAFTGQDANLVQAGSGLYNLTAAAGSYGLSGQIAGLLATRLLGGAAAAYSLSGQDAALKAAWRVTGDAPAFLLGGQDVGLYRGRVVAAAAATFALSGQVASFVRGYGVASEPGAFLLSGIAASFLAPDSNIYAPALSGVVLSAPALAGSVISAPALTPTVITAEPL